MFGRALPSILNGLTGREVISENHADTELIDAMATKVKPEQIKMLIAAGIITQEMGALLVARFNKTLERQQAEAAALKQLPPENSEAPT
jgi:hypothetical protein